MIECTSSSLFDTFVSPPAEFGQTPFWWWAGEKLTRERLAWQLDQLHAKGVLCAIISYNHDVHGATNLGDPPLFSEEWWELFRWVVAYCKNQGMQIGFQDYTIVNPTLQQIGQDCDEMRGFGSLRQISCTVSQGKTAYLQIEDGTVIVAGGAWLISSQSLELESYRDLTPLISDGCLRWKAPPGKWHVMLNCILPNSFDPTHPTSGEQSIERLYAIFEKECPGELGKTISILFQDELDFFNHSGNGFPIWSQRIEAEFNLRKGYELRPHLTALWHDIGPITVKVRIDYNDVCVRLLEENYFRPIFNWCEERGVLLGNDNCGRGRVKEGSGFYGDPFRTMRWYGAPGNDDAGPVRGHAFNGFKINSSIAHLYRRPGVWNEAFHSSGWGFTPAEILAGFNEDATAGATLFNLHGLYYTTFAGWWEWAPPDFHFRQPYWSLTESLWSYVRRISWLLSQGVHRCDVAIVYPITSIEAGMNGMEAEQHAFGLGRHLFEAGVDFDFIDFESLELANVEGGKLTIAGECYRVLIFPNIEAVRWSTLEKARDFAQNGGLVIAFGCLPQASERAGSKDEKLDTLVQEIWSMPSSVFVQDSYETVLQTINVRIVRDFVPESKNTFVLHRNANGKEIYFVFNRSPEKNAVEVFFRAIGSVEKWNAWDGTAHALENVRQTESVSALMLSLEPWEAQVIVFDPSHPNNVEYTSESDCNLEIITELNGEWQFELLPTLDNRFGDYRLPAFDGFVGAEARTFLYHPEDDSETSWSSSELDDSEWPEVTYSFGPRFWQLGPISPGTDFSEWELTLRKNREAPEGWKPYNFSLQRGIENDPFLKDPLSGPHGLKQYVPDDFIDLGQEPAGSFFYLWTSIEVVEKQTVTMQMGSRSSFASWLNGKEAVSQRESLPPGIHAPWGLPHYKSKPHKLTVTLEKGSNSLLLKFVSSGNQRLRGYVAFDPPCDQPKTLGLRWFNGNEQIRFHHRPGSKTNAAWYRFKSPPGLEALDITALGLVTQVWADGIELEVQSIASGEFRATLRTPLLLTSTVAIRIEPTPGSYAGDSLPTPIRFHCVTGITTLQDWSQLGLVSYSGGAWYRKTFYLEKDQADMTLFLDLGEVAVCAQIKVNGQFFGNKIAPPWIVNLHGFTREGTNQLEVLVMNTLANHYGAGIPSPYVFSGQTVSGLLGPVRILRRA